MSWTCPYEVNAYCKKLNRLCQPGMKGCVLDRGVKFIDLNKENYYLTQKKKLKN